MMICMICSGDGRIVLVDSLEMEHSVLNGLPPPLPAVDLELEKVNCQTNS